MFKKNRPVVLIILDGWGLAPKNKGNAIELAKKPNFDFLKENYPFTQLQASGKFVGLFENEPGNSEAGHLNLGAGRIVLDDAVVISQEIKNKNFFKNQVLKGAIEHVKKNKSRLHLMGILPEEPTAHGNPEHLLALIKLAKEEKVKEIYLHLFSDGRDTKPRSFLNAFRKIREKINDVKVASLIGRFYAMDRKKDWKKTEIAYNLLVLGEGQKFNNVEEAVSFAYNRSDVRPELLTDEYIQPSIFLIDRKIVTISDNDAVIFFNLRSDRARQLTKAFVQKEFNQKNPGSFKRKKVLKNLFFVALTNFGPDLDNIKTAYPTERIKNGLVERLKNFSQVYIAEKEKYAHVTYFFNGGYDQPYFNEKRILIPSLDVKSYDEVPEMKAKEVANSAILKIKENFDFITLNFANPDILGHTGNIKATIFAIELIDKLLKKIVETVLKKDGVAIITADHGNAEKMIDLETNEIFTGHTTNPVPFILVSKIYKEKKLKEGILADVAVTILEIFNQDKPKEMTGSSLIKS